MEYVKTQLQTFRKVAGGKPPPFTGIGSGLVYTVRTTGFLSLYNGLAPVRACDQSGYTYLPPKNVGEPAGTNLFRAQGWDTVWIQHLF